MWSSEAVTRELVEALRGERSQVALSRRLGFKSNVAYLWESGRRAPTAAGFCWLAHRVGVDVRSALSGFAQDDPGEAPWEPPAVAAWLDRLRGRRSTSELARAIGRDRHAVRRWLSGEAEPRMPDLLDLVEAITTRGLDLVSRFADPALLPSVAEAWRRLEAARRAAQQLPWTPAVRLALELRAYRERPHEEGWIAARLQLPVEDERACLAALAEAGQIRWDGARWEPVEVQAVDTRTPQRRSDAKRFWAGVARDRIDAEGLASWNVFAVSEADFARVQELQRQYYREIRAIAAASPAAERVVLANLQLLALDGQTPKRSE